ncbi:hypothetical protein KY363_01875, partial [Candidatus Woesearchaeota archaeon]|nr:hypothetical protein [Candidatus Woesearchaeota archaeon]
VPSQVKAILNWDPNPPCCGTGAYETTEKGKLVCRQALLRTNENGSGLPALLVSFLAFFLLFKVFGDKLGFGDTGSGGGKWLPIILSGVLAALMTNQRVTKNTIIMIAGWVAVVLIGTKLSKKWSENTEEGGSRRSNHTKKLFAFGLAVAAVELACNLLGGSLFGGTVAAGDISFGRILWVLVIGLPFGFVYSLLTTDGLWRRIRGKADDEWKRRVDEDFANGNYGKSIFDNRPEVRDYIAEKRRKEEEKKARLLEAMNQQLAQLTAMYNANLAARPPNQTELENLDRQIRELRERYFRMIEENKLPEGHAAPAMPPSPTSTADRGPPGLP